MGKAIEASRTRFSQTCQIGDDTTFGVIKLILHAEGYDWELISDGHRDAVQGLGSGTATDLRKAPDATHANLGAPRFSVAATVLTDAICSIGGSPILPSTVRPTGSLPASCGTAGQRRIACIGPGSSVLRDSRGASGVGRGAYVGRPSCIVPLSPLGKSSQEIGLLTRPRPLEPGSTTREVVTIRRQCA